MKNIYRIFKSVLLIVLGLLMHSNLIAQGGTCAAATQICGGASFPAVTGGGDTGTSGNSNCLSTTRNETWFYVFIDGAGSISTDLSISPSSDIDFAAWGPFTSPPSAGTCGMISTANEVSCDFTTTNGGTLSIPSAVVGQYYYLLISNFGDDAGTITASPVAGTGSISCDPPPCAAIGTTMLNIGACQGMGTTSTADDIFTVSLDVDFANATSAAVTLDGAAMTSANTNTTTGGIVTYTIDLLADGTTNNGGVVVIGDGSGTCTIDFTDFTSPASCSPVGCDADAGTAGPAGPITLCNLGQGTDMFTAITNGDFEMSPADPCGLAGTPGVAFGLYTALPTSDDTAVDPNFISLIGSAPLATIGSPDIMQNIEYGNPLAPTSFGPTVNNAATNFNTTFFVCPIYLFDESVDPVLSAVDYDCGLAEDLCQDVNEAGCVQFQVLSPILFANDALVCGGDPYLGTLTVDVSGGLPTNDGSMFTVSNTGANGTLAATMAANGGTITLSDIANGPFEITVMDANGCSNTFVGVWNQPTITLNACETKFCEFDNTDGTNCDANNTSIGCITGSIIPQLGQFRVCGGSDSFSDETTWQITNSAGVAVTNGGPGSGGVITWDAPSSPLDPNDTYFITFFDSFGDGWSCGDATIVVVDDGGNGCAGTAVYTYTAGDWFGATCGTGDDSSFPNGSGDSFGPFPLGSPTSFIDPVGTITGPGVTQQMDTADADGDGNTTELINVADFDATAAGVGVHVVSFDFVDGQGCILSETVSIEVCANPDAPTVDAIEVCPGSDAMYNVTAPAGVTISVFGPSATAPTDVTTGAIATGTTGTITAPNIGDTYYFVSEEVDAVSGLSCFSCVTPVTVISSPLPMPAPTASMPCDGEDDLLLMANITGGTAPYVSFMWEGPTGQTSTDENPVISPATLANDAGTWSVTVTDTEGCEGIATVNVTVLPIPNAPTCDGTEFACEGNPQGEVLDLVATCDDCETVTMFPAGPIETITLTYSGPTVSIDATQNAPAGMLTFAFTDDPANPNIPQVLSVDQIVVNYDKTDGSCAAPATGSSFLGEFGIGITDPNSTNYDLVTQGDYSGSTDITPGVMQTFVDNNTLPIAGGGGTPASGTFFPAGGWPAVVGADANGTWAVNGSDDAGGDPLCIQSWSITITAQEPAFSMTTMTPATVNWYDAATGGNLILAGNDTYNPTVNPIGDTGFDINLPGTYTFYSECVCDGCPSERTGCQVIINEQPEAPSCGTNPDEFCEGEDIPDFIYVTSATVGGSEFTVKQIDGTVLGGPTMAMPVASFDIETLLGGTGPGTLAPGSYQFLVTETIAAGGNGDNGMPLFCESAPVLCGFTIIESADPTWGAAAVCCTDAPILLSAGCDATPDAAITNTLGVDFGTAPTPNSGCGAGNVNTVTNAGDAGVAPDGVADATTEVFNDATVTPYNFSQASFDFLFNGGPSPTAANINGAVYNIVVNAPANAVISQIDFAVEGNDANSSNFNEWGVWVLDPNTGDYANAALGSGTNDGNPVWTAAFGTGAIASTNGTMCSVATGMACADAGSPADVGPCAGGFLDYGPIMQTFTIAINDPFFSDVVVYGAPNEGSVTSVIATAMFDNYTPCTECTVTVVPCATGGADPSVNYDPTASWTGDGVYFVDNPDGDLSTDDSYYYFDPAIGTATIAGVGTGAPILAEGEISVLYLVGEQPCQEAELHDFYVSCSVNAIIDDFTACTSPSAQFDLTALFGTMTTPGGVFTQVGGSGTISGNIYSYDPNITSSETITVTYTVGNMTVDIVPNDGGCWEQDDAILVIQPSPMIDFDLPDGPLCTDGRDLLISNFLTGETITNGQIVFTQITSTAGSVLPAPTTLTGVDFTIDVSVLDPGDYSVTYTETIDNGTDPDCVSTQTEYFSVFPSGSPDWMFTGPVCIDDAAYTLAPTTAPAQGVPFSWSVSDGQSTTGTGDGTVATASFDWTPTQAGVYLATFCVGAGPCEMCESIVIDVKASVNSTITDITICEDFNDFNLTSMFSGNATTTGGFFTLDCDGAGGDDPVTVNGNEITFASTCAPDHTTGTGFVASPAPENEVIGVGSGVMNGGFTPVGFTDNYFFNDDDSDGNGAAARSYTLDIGTFDLSDDDECDVNRAFSFDYMYRPLGGDVLQVIVDDGANPAQTFPLAGTTTSNNGATSTFTLDLTAIGATTNAVTISIDYDDNGGWQWYHAIDNIELVYGSNVAGTGNDVIYSEDFGAGGASYATPAAAAATVASATSFDFQTSPIIITPGVCEVTYTIDNGACMSTSTAMLTITPNAAFRPDAFTVCAGEDLNLNPTTIDGTWTVTPAAGGTIANDIFTADAGANGTFEICYTFETVDNPCEAVCYQVQVLPAADATILDLEVCTNDTNGFNLTSMFLGGTTTPGGSFCIDLGDGNGPIDINGNEIGFGGTLTVGDPASLANTVTCDPAFGGLSADDGTLPFGSWISGMGGDPYFFFDDDQATGGATACGEVIAFTIPATDVSTLANLTLQYTAATLNNFGNVFEVYAVWSGGANEALLMGNTHGNPSNENIDVLATAPGAVGATDLVIEFRFDDSNGWAWGFGLDDIVLTGDGAVLFSEDFQIDTPMPITVAPGVYPVTYKVGGDCLVTQTANLTIRYVPVLAAVPAQEICGDGVTTIDIGALITDVNGSDSHYTIDNIVATGGITQAAAVIGAVGQIGGVNPLMAEVYTNTTGMVQTVTYTIQGFNDEDDTDDMDDDSGIEPLEDCTGNTIEIVVTVYPQVDATIANAEVCMNAGAEVVINGSSISSFDLTQLNTIGIFTPLTSTGGTFSTTNTNVTIDGNLLLWDTANFIADEAIDITYAVGVAGQGTADPADGDCYGEGTATFTLRYVPTLNDVMPQEICGDGTTTIDLGTLITEANGFAAHYTIDNIVATGGITQAAATVGQTGQIGGTNPLMAEVYTNTTGMTQTVTYTIQSFNDEADADDTDDDSGVEPGEDCTGNTIEIVVTVYPQVIGDIVSMTACQDDIDGFYDMTGMFITDGAGANGTFTGNTTTGGTFTIVDANTNTVPVGIIQNGSIITYTPSVTFPLVLKVRYAVGNTDVNSTCADTDTEILIIENPELTYEAPPMICIDGSGQQFSILPTVTGKMFGSLTGGAAITCNYGADASNGAADDPDTMDNPSDPGVTEGYAITMCTGTDGATNGNACAEFTIDAMTGEVTYTPTTTNPEGTVTLEVTFTSCYGCTDTYEIPVMFINDMAQAQINDIAVCPSPSNTIDVEGLFGPATPQGGQFTLVNHVITSGTSGGGSVTLTGTQLNYDSATDPNFTALVCYETGELVATISGGFDLNSDDVIDANDIADSDNNGVISKAELLAAYVILNTGNIDPTTATTVEELVTARNEFDLWMNTVLNVAFACYDADFAIVKVKADSGLDFVLPTEICEDQANIPLSIPAALQADLLECIDYIDADAIEANGDLDAVVNWTVTNVSPATPIATITSNGAMDASGELVMPDVTEATTYEVCATVTPFMGEMIYCGDAVCYQITVYPQVIADITNFSSCEDAAPGLFDLSAMLITDGSGSSNGFNGDGGNGIGNTTLGGDWTISATPGVLLTGSIITYNTATVTFPLEIEVSYTVGQASVNNTCFATDTEMLIIENPELTYPAAPFVCVNGTGQMFTINPTVDGIQIPVDGSGTAVACNYGATNNPNDPAVYPPNPGVTAGFMITSCAATNAALQADACADITIDPLTGIVTYTPTTNPPSGVVTVEVTFTSCYGCTDTYEVEVVFEDQVVATLQDADICSSTSANISLDDIMFTNNVDCNGTITPTTPGGSFTIDYATSTDAAGNPLTTTLVFMSNDGLTISYDPTGDLPYTVNVTYAVGMSNANGTMTPADCDDCYAEDDATIVISDSYQAYLDVPEICLGTENPSQLMFENYLTINDANGDVVYPADFVEGDDIWEIVSFNGSTTFTAADAGSIDPDTGVYTPGTGEGFVTIRYTLTETNTSSPAFNCQIIEEDVFELRQPLVFTPGECECDVAPPTESFRSVDLGTITGGLAPYEVSFTGGGIDSDSDGTVDQSTGSYTVMTDGTDLGELIIDPDGMAYPEAADDRSWSVTIIDARGCEITANGYCDPLLDVPAWLGANTPSCFTDGVFDISLSNAYDFIADSIRITKLANADIDAGTCENFMAFNAAVDFTDVFVIDDASDIITVFPENLVGDDYRYGGTYLIELIIPASEATDCKTIVVEEEITIYPSLDACFDLPLEICGNVDTIRIDIEEEVPGFDLLAPDLLCRDRDEMSVWQLIAPDTTIIGIGTDGTLLEEGAVAVDANGNPVPLVVGQEDGDVTLHIANLFNYYGAGHYTLNHSLGIDICETACAVTFEILSSPTIVASTNMPIVCSSDNISLVVDSIYGGAQVYNYSWFFEDTNNPALYNVFPYPSIPVYQDTLLPADTFMISVADLEGLVGPIAQGVYPFIVQVIDATGCVGIDTVFVGINPDPTVGPDIVNAIYCETNKADGFTTPVNGFAYSTSTLTADCSVACASIVAPDGVAIPAPIVNWYASATSTTPLFDLDADKDGEMESDLDGNTSTFDPVAAGLVNGNEPGTYTFWAECVCIPGEKCVSPRVEVKLVVLDCSGCTYLLVMEDLGNNGWDGASLDVSINENWPADNYKVITDECGNADVLIVPISVNDGGTIDLEYWNGALENEHNFFVLDPLGNIANDVNGVPVNYTGFPPSGELIRIKAECPENCTQEAEYTIVNTLGASPYDQAWELRDGSGAIVISAIPGTYDGLAPGTVITDVLNLSSCEDYTFTAFDGPINGWAGGGWEIISTNPDRGSVILDANGNPTGNFLIASGPANVVNGEQNCTFTIPCDPVDCPSDMLEITNNTADCELTGFVHPAPPTPFVCYPNCGHAIPGPVTTISYPGIGVVGVDPTTAIDLPVGPNDVVFEITYTDGQIVRCSSTVNVVTTLNPVLTCNDLVNISLAGNSISSNADCFTEVTADDVLENTLPCEGQYIVTVFDLEGQSLGSVVGPDQAGQTLQYEVQHIGSNNICWGQLTVEDKLAPIVVCNDYQIECTHPFALDENYTHVDDLAADAADLPGIIAGDVGSNISLTVPAACTPLGEQVLNVAVSIETTHTRTSDLAMTITAPNGTSVTTGVPASASALRAFRGVPYTMYGGAWTIDIVDNNGVVVAGDFGRGAVLNATISVTAGFPTPGVVADCSAVTFEVIDEQLVDTDCDQGEWNGAMILRTWQAIDAFGNSSTCTQTVGLRAPMDDQINRPGDVTIECGTEQLDENGAIDIAQSGGISYGCFDLTSDQHGYCDVSITFEDQVLPACGNSYKVIRRWTVLSWCSGNTHVYDQTIKIEDATGPQINIADIEVSSAPYDCATGVLNLSPAVSDNCSGIAQITATYTQGGGAFNQVGTLVIVDITNGQTIDGLPFGITQVEINAQDNCGNETTEVIDVNVADNSAPVAICDDELHISVGADGTARIFAEDFDEGSYDNCGDVTIEISNDDINYGDFVEVSCTDTIVTLYLLVTDVSGNTNTCWAEILVEDALAPVLTCPADLTITCNDEAVHAPFGEATAIDNCNVEITHVDGGGLDQCQAGVLTRTFTASDGSDKSVDATCTQRVTVEHVSDFVVQFPSDVTLTDCVLQDAGEPTITNDDCELLAISSEDLILYTAADACYTIERTWTIINWCVYEEGNAANTDLGFPQPLPRTYRDDDGYFTYVQTINVLDNDAPIITNPGDQSFCDLTEGCEGQADLVLEASDACSSAEVLEYTYKIDAFNDGTFDIIVENGGNDASGIYPYGTHLIKWIVEDGCGNTASESYLFTVEDCKNPTPVCLNGITLPGMNSDGCVEVWASDLLEYAFDNCSSDEMVESTVRIRREGDLGSPQSVITLCCDTDGIGNIGVEVWVEDEAGNADYCTTYIGLQDPNGICGSTDDARYLAGTIETESGERVENVAVEVTGGMTSDMTTTSSGDYSFYVPMSNNYTIVPTNDNDPLNGVTTFDLVLISQHILGINELSSAYQMIAADVNNDGNITTFDIVQTRQLILYVIQDFPSNSSWRFVDADYVFPDANNPWMEAFPEVIDYENVTVNKMEGDFIGVKIGDVNGDATANSLLGAEDRNDGTMQLMIEDATIEGGTSTRIDFRAKDFQNINGYQFTIEVDGLELQGIESGELNVTEGNFGLTMLNEGAITTSWNTSEAMNVQDETILFSINVKANNTTSIKEAVQISSRYTAAEAYAGNNLYNVELGFTGEVLASAAQFELYQNKPNPFKGETVIGFNLPTASTASITVMDVSGKVLRVIESDYAKGYNQVTFDSKSLQGTGVLYYQLDTPTNTATKKMIILE